MVSHYDCEKQDNLRQVNLLNVKQCTEATSIIQQANVNARLYVGATAKRIKLTNVLLMRKNNAKYIFKVPLNIDVLIELCGIITPWYFM